MKLRISQTFHKNTQNFTRDSLFNEREAKAFFHKLLMNRLYFFDFFKKFFFPEKLIFYKVILLTLILIMIVSKVNLQTVF